MEKKKSNNYIKERKVITIDIEQKFIETNKNQPMVDNVEIKKIPVMLDSDFSPKFGFSIAVIYDAQRVEIVRCFSEPFEENVNVKLIDEICDKIKAKLLRYSLGVDDIETLTIEQCNSLKIDNVLKKKER